MNSSERDWTKEVEDLVAYCGRYDPTFARKIVGAAVAEIDHAETLAGMAFAPEYRAFLTCMGRTPPKSLGRFLEHVTFGIDAILAYYGDPPLPVPHDAAYLWTYEDDSPYLIFLPADGEVDDKRPLLQFGWAIDPISNQFIDREIGRVALSDGLLPYLYNDAFDGIRRPSLAYGVALEEAGRIRKPDPGYTQERCAKFRAIVERLGFQPLPWMERNLLLYDRKDAAVALAWQEIAVDTIYVGADDEREAGRLSDILSDNLDMRRR